jgi:cell wall-associated NlpC family hydrolase
MASRLTPFLAAAFALLATACHWQPPSSNEGQADTARLVSTDTAFAKTDTTKVDSRLVVSDSTAPDNTANRDTAFLAPSRGIDTKGVAPADVAAFAKTLVGIPYVYGSINPKVGFDCSGFITYVFNHFGIAVPRSSIDFTTVGTSVPANAARTGDLILFTGTNPAERHVGHMGLVITSAPDSIQFVHSSSGKAHGVTITPLNAYYKTRFVKVIRVFE